LTAAYRPVVLCILDGLGIAPDSPSNAATRADTPRLDAILRDQPHAKLEASGGSRVAVLSAGATISLFSFGLFLVRLRRFIATSGLLAPEILQEGCLNLLLSGSRAAITAAENRRLQSGKLDY